MRSSISSKKPLTNHWRNHHLKTLAVDVRKRRIDFEIPVFNSPENEITATENKHADDLKNVLQADNMVTIEQQPS